MRLVFVCVVSAILFWPLNQAIAIEAKLELLAAATADYIRLAVACGKDWHPTLSKTFATILLKGDDPNEFAGLVKMYRSGKSECNQENFDQRRQGDQDVGTPNAARKPDDTPPRLFATLADMSDAPTKPEPIPFPVEVTVNGVRVTVTLMLRPGTAVLTGESSPPVTVIVDGNRAR